MKILHVITGLSHGGAENVLYRLIEHSGDSSSHTVVSMLDEGVFGPRLRSVGADLHCLRMTQGGIPRPGHLFELVATIKRVRPAVIQTWMSHADLLGGIAGRMAGVPVCWGIHHSKLSAEDHKRGTRVVAWTNARLSGWVPAQVVSCSQRSAEFLQSVGYPGGRIVIIPNGVDVSRFSPVTPERRAAVRATLGIPENARVMGHLGRADLQKDHKSLIESFSYVADSDPDCLLLLAGQDLKHGSEYFDDILRGVGRPDLHRRILALGPRDDVVDLMNAIDIFVLSSSSGEAFPMVLLEAMATGTPCVTTDVGDSAEIVGDTGWVLPPKNPSGLAMAVLDAFAEGPEIHRLRSERARARIVDRFGIDHMVEAYASVWHRVAPR